MARYRFAAVLGAITVLVFVSPPARSAPFTFVNIADSTDPQFSSFDLGAAGAPAISNNGTVAFYAATPTGEGVFTARIMTPANTVEDQVTAGDPTNGATETFTNFPDSLGPAINNAGSVAFHADFQEQGGGSGEGIYRFVRPTRSSARGKPAHSVLARGATRLGAPTQRGLRLGVSLARTRRGAGS